MSIDILCFSSYWNFSGQNEFTGKMVGTKRRERWELQTVKPGEQKKEERKDNEDTCPKETETHEDPEKGTFFFVSAFKEFCAIVISVRFLMFIQFDKRP